MQEHHRHAQPYPPYEAAPPRKPRVWLWLSIGAAVLAIILVASAFITKPAFLGFKKVLDHNAVEKTIESTGYTNVSATTERIRR